MEGNPKSSDRSAKKKEKRLLKKSVKKAEENQEVIVEKVMEMEDNPQSDGLAKRMKRLVEEAEENETGRIRSQKSNDKRMKKLKNKTTKGLLKEIDKPEKQEEEDGNGESILEEDEDVEEQEVNAEGRSEEEKPDCNNKISESGKSNKKKRLLEEAAKADQRGVCYLSRIPPRMDHVKLRQILSQYGEIQRIYLAPEDTAAQVPRKRANRKRDGGFQEQGFSEGWVEFTKKSVAKRVANMLNGEQIGGRKRSSFYYDLWNIKYLSKFKWDDLTEEIAYKNAIREQKLALEISAAKRERDFYLSKVDKSRALSSIEERLKKKQKVEQEPKTSSELPVTQQVTKVIRQFPQKRPVADNATQSKSRLSREILAGVFGGS